MWLWHVPSKKRMTRQLGVSLLAVGALLAAAALLRYGLDFSVNLAVLVLGSSCFGAGVNARASAGVSVRLLDGASALVAGYAAVMLAFPPGGLALPVVLLAFVVAVAAAGALHALQSGEAT